MHTLHGGWLVHYMYTPISNKFVRAFFMVVKSSRRRGAREGSAATEDGTTRVPPTANNFIRAWRLFRGIDRQQDLADRSGVGRPVLSRLESGSLDYHQRHLEQLAKVLQCTAGDLISTDPSNMGDVFRIYEDLPPSGQLRAYQLLRSLRDDMPKRKSGLKKKK